MIKVSIKPYEEYLKFDISRAWFLSKARGETGELILTKRCLTITFRFREKIIKSKGRIVWDSNEKSLNGFNPKVGWVKVDLIKLFHIHRVYELKKKLQSKASKRSKLKKS